MISGPNPIENTRTRTPHQRATRKWPELVKEHHEAQNEQKGNDVANNAAAKRCRCEKILDPMTLTPRPDDVPARFRRYDAIAAISGKRSSRYPSRIMVNGDRVFDGLRSRPCRLALDRLERRLDQRGNSAETEPAADEFAHRDLVGGIEDGRGGAAGASARRASASAGNRTGSGSSNVSVAIRARSSRAAGVSMRTGQARQCAIGMRISGEPSCATTEPSRNSTSPCTTDCGWTTTSSSLGPSANRWCASISSRPLFISVAESMVTFGPIVQVGCLSACSSVTLLHRLERPGAEWPAGSGQHDPPHVLAPARAQRLEDRVVLGIDRQHRGARRGRAAHEQRAGADEAFLVGERNGRAALGGGERRLEAGRAGDRRHDPIGRSLRRLDDGVAPAPASMPEPDKLSLEFAHRCPDRRPRRSARRVRARAAPVRRHCDWPSRLRPGSGRVPACSRSIVLEPIEPVAPRSVTERGSVTPEFRARDWLRLRHRLTIAASRAPGHPTLPQDADRRAAAKAATRKPSRRSITPAMARE